MAGATRHNHSCTTLLHPNGEGSAPPPAPRSMVMAMGDQQRTLGRCYRTRIPSSQRRDWGASTLPRSAPAARRTRPDPRRLFNSHQVHVEVQVSHCTPSRPPRRGCRPGATTLASLVSVAGRRARAELGRTGSMISCIMVLGRNPAPIPPTLGPIPAPLPTVDVRTMIWSTCGRLFLCLFLYKFLVVGCRCRCCYSYHFL